jgi:hypothetical protein
MSVVPQPLALAHGPTGASDTTGSGAQGPTGASDTTGSGAQGPTGASDTTGSGAQGPTGASDTTGSGAQGPTGASRPVPTNGQLLTLTPTYEERCLFHFFYELSMLVYANCSLKEKGVNIPHMEKAMLIEAWALHARNVIEFFIGLDHDSKYDKRLPTPGQDMPKDMPFRAFYLKQDAWASSKTHWDHVWGCDVTCGSVTLPIHFRRYYDKAVKTDVDMDNWRKRINQLISHLDGTRLGNMENDADIKKLNAEWVPTLTSEILKIVNEQFLSTENYNEIISLDNGCRLSFDFVRTGAVPKWE